MADYVRAAERAAKGVRSGAAWVAEVLADGLEPILDFIFGPVPIDRATSLGPYEYPEFFATTGTPDASADMLRGAADDTAAATVQPAAAAGVDEQEPDWRAVMDGPCVRCGLTGLHVCEPAVQPAPNPWVFEPSLTVDEVRALRTMIDERFPLQACSAPVEPSPSPGVPGAESPTPEFDWVTWVIPAIVEALADVMPNDVLIYCAPDSLGSPTTYGMDWQAWREHVAPIIAARIHLAARQQ